MEETDCRAESSFEKSQRKNYNDFYYHHYVSLLLDGLIFLEIKKIEH